MYSTASSVPRNAPTRNGWREPKPIGRALLLCLMMFPLLAAAAHAQPLRPRQAAHKGDNYSLPPQTVVERLVLKFQEGTRVRWRDRVLIALDRSEREQSEVARLGLDEAQ